MQRRATNDHKKRFNQAAAAWLLALTLLVAAAWPALAQDQAATPPSVDAALPALPTAAYVSARLITADAQLTVGDPTSITVEVRHPAGYQVFLPELGNTWGPFDLLDLTVKETTPNSDGSETTRQTLSVALFAPGDHWTPMLALTVSDPQGNLSQAMAEPVLVQVASVLNEPNTELRDIKAQASMSIPALWPAWLLGALALLALLGVLWRQIRGRRQDAVDKRTPEEAAYDDLARIDGLGLPTQGAFKEQYAQVTHCLWRYIERQYGVPATDLTTAELKRSLRSTPMSEAHVQTFVDLFSDCDLVKFSTFNPSVEAANQLLVQARQLIQTTAAEAAQQAAENDNHANGANPPSASAAVSTTVVRA